MSGITITYSNFNHHDNRLIVGYTTTEHLLLDLDDTSIDDVIGLVRLLVQSYPEIGSCLIIQSSTRKTDSSMRINRHGIPTQKFKGNSYHIVANNKITYARAVQIFSTLVELNILDTAHKRIRGFRGDMTLRVSPMVCTNQIKPIPIDVAYVMNLKHDNGDNMIDVYRRFRRSVFRFFSLDDDAETKANYEGDSSHDASSRQVVNVVDQGEDAIYY